MLFDSWWVSFSQLVSFITTVKAIGNTVSRTHGDDAESDRLCESAYNVVENNETVDEQDDVEYDKTDDDEEEVEDKEDHDVSDDYHGDDGSIGGSTLDATLDGSEGTGEDYD